MSKRIVRKPVNECYVDFDIVDGKTPDEIIAHMKKFKDQFKDRNVYFNIEYYSDGKDLYLYEARLETDQEYNARITEETAIEEKRTAKERAEYERLRSKFEK